RPSCCLSEVYQPRIFWAIKRHVSQKTDASRYCTACICDRSTIAGRSSDANCSKRFSFLCASNDFRVLDTSFLQPQQVLAPSGGRPVAHLVISVGFGINLLNVVSAGRKISP